MSRWRGVLATLVTATVVGTSAVAAPPASATLYPSSTYVDPATFPAGTPPVTSYLRGRTIHPGGDQPPLAMPKAWLGRLQLVGRTSRGWYVSRITWTSTTLTSELYRVTRHARTLVAKRTTDRNHSTQWFLSSDNQRIVSVQGGIWPAVDDHLQVLDLDGRLVRKRADKWAKLTYLGSTEDDVWIGWGDGVIHRWSMATGKDHTVVDEDGAVALPAYDRLFTFTTANPVGVDSRRLSSPGTPTWSSGVDWTPEAVSPDGRYVAGVLGRPIADQDECGDGIVIARMSDGTVVQSLTFNDGTLDRSQAWPCVVGDVWWDAGDSVLFDYRFDAVNPAVHQRMVGRCDLAGSCTVAIPDATITHRSVMDFHNNERVSY
ncbi:hypothetical protein [Nocardioides ultimimeridianus]